MRYSSPSVLFGLCLVASFLLMTPTVSQAIPSTGDYEFASGLTGAFTSTGANLTAWDIAYPRNINQIAPSIRVSAINNTLSFLEMRTSAEIFAQVPIDGGQKQFAFIDYRLLDDPPIGKGVLLLSFNQRSPSVFEPNVMILLGLALGGLLALIEYRWRQRRRAGMSVR